MVKKSSLPDVRVAPLIPGQAAVVRSDSRLVLWRTSLLEGCGTPPKGSSGAKIAVPEFSSRVARVLSAAMCLDHDVDLSGSARSLAMVEERLCDIAERLRGVWFQPTEFLDRFRGHAELPPMVLGVLSNSWHDLAIGIAHAVVVGARGALKKGAALSDVLESYRIMCQAWPDLMAFHTRLADESLKAERMATGKVTLLRKDNARGQGDNEKGQKKKRPLNERAAGCLAAFNRKRDQGNPIPMAEHCREFCEKAGDDESVYRTLKDYSDLWHKPAKKGTRKGTK